MYSQIKTVGGAVRRFDLPPMRPSATPQNHFFLRGPVLNTGTLRTGLIDGSAGATSPLSTHLPRLRLPPPPEVLGFFGFFGFFTTCPLASVSGTRCSGSKSCSICRVKV